MGPVRGWGPHGLSIWGCCCLAKWAAAGRKRGPWVVSFLFFEKNPVWPTSWGYRGAPRAETLAAVSDKLKPSTSEAFPLEHRGGKSMVPRQQTRLCILAPALSDHEILYPPCTPTQASSCVQEVGVLGYNTSLYPNTSLLFFFCKMGAGNNTEFTSL